MVAKNVMSVAKCYVWSQFQNFELMLSEIEKAQTKLLRI